MSKMQSQRVGFIQAFERLTSQELLTLSVGDLAQKFSCTRRHLNRLFHRYFGFSVAALRMENALAERCLRTKSWIKHQGSGIQYPVSSNQHPPPIQNPASRPQHPETSEDPVRRRQRDASC